METDYRDICVPTSLDPRSRIDYRQMWSTRGSRNCDDRFYLC